MEECFLPRQCFAGPGRRFSLCPLSPALPGPRMSWAPAPDRSALPHLGSAQVPNVLSHSAHCPVSLDPSPCPSLRRFCHLPPGIPAAGRGPVPTESPRSPDLRSPGYSEEQWRGWSGCPANSDCPGRKRTRTWSCSWLAFRHCRVRSPCWWRSSSGRRCSGRPGCGGSGPVCQRSSGLSRSPGLQEEEATHRAGSCNRLQRKQRERKRFFISR